MSLRLVLLQTQLTDQPKSQAQSIHCNKIITEAILQGIYHLHYNTVYVELLPGQIFGDLL